MSSLKSAPIYTLYHKAQAISIFSIVCYSSGMNCPSTESSAEIESLLTAPIDTNLQLWDCNQRLSELFGGDTRVVASLAPRFMLEMPMVQQYPPLIGYVSRIEYSTYLRPDTNELVKNNIAVTSPYRMQGDRFPLVGIKVFGLDDDPCSAGVSFEITPVPTVATIYSIMTSRQNIIDAGRLKVNISEISR